MTMSTAQSVTARDFTTNRFSQILVVICVSVWVWAAIDPVYPFDWFLENILVAAAIVLVVLIYKAHPLSDTSHLMMAVFFCMHVAASHYTYSEVPWGLWAKEAFNMERNHYDRIVHCSFGLLLAYPVRELLMRRYNLQGFVSYFFAFAVMVASSEIYELIEWITAVIVDPEAGTAFLGTQGDPFDAQKDTALALVGTVSALTLTRLFERR